MVDPNLVEAVKKQEALEAQAHEWENNMREAMINAQKETYKLHQAGEISNTIFDATPETMMNQYEDEGEIDLNFFNSLNNF